MVGKQGDTRRIQGYCALCISRCGAVGVVEQDRLVALEPDPTHPTGHALCAKGHAAPELVYSAERLLYPLKRTRPKGDPDPGWQRISWDEALHITASRLRAVADATGAESVAFSLVSPSTSAIFDAQPWVQRLMRAFGTPNLCAAMELCGWGRIYATSFAFGTGAAMPDLENAGCILFWGYNPSSSRLAHATATVQALKRGARLIVVDPRRVGLASKADVWLRVRPGTDAALALGLAHMMIERNWYDRDFIRDWTNGPLLVRQDTGRLLTEADLGAGSAQKYVAWDTSAQQPVAYDPALRRYESDGAEPALEGAYTITSRDGPIVCCPVFQVCADAARQYPSDVVERITGVGHEQLHSAARLLWESRPVAYYAWSGVEQHTNTTQIYRAISFLYALTGSFDACGGNVVFPAVPTANLLQLQKPSPELPPTLGLGDRPLGAGRDGFVTTDELYRAIQERRPYPVLGLVGFGANLLLSHSDTLRGRAALAALDFYVHLDLFMNPTAELADIVLPVTSPFESEGLKVGFEISPSAQSLVQLRHRMIPPRGEARSDVEIVFELACRLGLGEHFWNGDIDAGYRHQLGPSGVSLDDLRANPAGLRVPLETRYRKYAQSGFGTPTGKVELYSETLLQHGYAAVPEHRDPVVGPRSRQDLALLYPLILTCAKNGQFCQTQHRALPSLRRRALDPELEVHPQLAASRGIQAGDWVEVESPNGSMRARARFNESLDPEVVCGEHGWWQACPDLSAPGYDPFSAVGSNYNLLISNAAIDPTSGTVPHRSYMCQVTRAT